MHGQTRFKINSYNLRKNEFTTLIVKTTNLFDNIVIKKSYRPLTSTA